MGSHNLCFMIVDGYDSASRGQLQAAGMKLAADLYREMLERQLPGARSLVLFPSDPGTAMPDGAAVASLDGLLWTGCNATIYDLEPRVQRQIELSRKAYEVGTPQFGSCWGLQMAVVAAGGEVRANPKGREMGIARRLWVTDPGTGHRMMQGRSRVFEAFTSHVDEVTRLPQTATHLAGNAFCAVQAAAVRHGAGEFWGVQYHPEYDLHEMARLTVAREDKLTAAGFYRCTEDLQRHVELLEALHAEPTRSDLRWLLAIDDDVLDATVRVTEFRNWLEALVLPRAARR